MTGIFLFLFVFLFSSPAFASEGDVSIDAILESLLSDEYPVSHIAEEVVILFSEGGPEVSRYKIGKLKPHKMRKEKYNLKGEIVEVIVNDDELQIVAYPQKKVVIRNPYFKEDLSRSRSKDLVELVKKNYRVNVEGAALIDGRRAIIVSIAPKEGGSRPSFKVWIDHETAIPLKTEAYALDGALSYLSTLSNVVINPSFSRDYFVIMVPPGTRAYEQSTPQKEVSARQSDEDKPFLGRLSGGYVLKDQVVDQKGDVQLIYHDGLNSISVFTEEWEDGKFRLLKDLAEGPEKMVERVKKNGFEGFFCKRGADNVVSFVSNKKRFIVVGEVSREGLLEIAVELNKRSR